MRNNICQREEKQCPQGQGKAVSESKSAHCQTYVKNHKIASDKAEATELSRALPSRGMFAGTVPFLGVPMEIETLALSTSGNVQTGQEYFLYDKMCKSLEKYKS